MKVTVSTSHNLPLRGGFMTWPQVWLDGNYRKRPPPNDLIDL